MRISQALSNLLANAVKFTEQGTVAIDVSLQAQAGDDYILRFDVRDTGVGISREAIERIFDPVNQIVARVMLTKLGCKVAVANDGQEALDLVRRQPFDLVLMDCHMPNLDGFAAAAALREMEAGGHPRHIIIAQTANAMEGDRDTCIAAGMDDYLPKPFTAAMLAETLRRWAPLVGRQASAGEPG